MLALVNVEMEGAALLGCKLLAAQGHLMKLGHEQASEKCRVLLPYRPLREFPQEDRAGVHHGAKIKPALTLSNDPAHKLSAQEGIKPREDRPLRLADKKRKLALPIEAEMFIGD